MDNNDSNLKYCVVIPIYKKELNKYEILSLNQCCNILKKHLIIFVTHKDLDCKLYNNICQNHNISYKYEYFSKKYFKNIYGYNALMLSKSFYKRFLDYLYILIYQLDAFVFRDELEYWCNKGYDYIGAPWLEINKSEPIVNFVNQVTIGNGGFSLRNTKKSIDKLKWNLKLLPFSYLFKSFYIDISLKSSKYFLYYFPRFILYFILKILRLVFIKNDFFNKNEDVVWTEIFNKKGNLPSVQEALKFSFELYPEYLYKLNNENLPFGCHAWYMYYNYLFYRDHIKNI